MLSVAGFLCTSLFFELSVLDGALFSCTFMYFEVFVYTAKLLKWSQCLSLIVIHEVSGMLARIVYYMKDSIPKEQIVVTNSLERAKMMAWDTARKLKAVDFEVEWVA